MYYIKIKIYHHSGGRYCGIQKKKNIEVQLIQENLQ